MGNSVSSEQRKDVRSIINAIKRRDGDALRTIISEKPTLSIRPSLWRHRTPLHTAAKHGDILCISMIVWAAEQINGNSRDDILNASDFRGMTPIARASKHGRLDVVRALLEEGASPLLANKRGDTPLHLSALRRYTDVVEELLSASVENRLSNSSSSIAAEIPIPTAFGEMRYIDAASNDGFTALHLACICRSSRTVAALVARGAALDAPVLRGLDRFPFLCGGSTPLHIAAAQGDVATCLILVEAQWRQNDLELWRIRNIYGLTPLNCAVSAGNFDIVRILVSSSRRSIGVSRVSDLRRGWRSNSINFLDDSGIPYSMKQHLLSMVKRAQLLISLRQMAKNGKIEGVTSLQQTPLSKVDGIERLDLKRLRQVKRLLSRPNVSFREIMVSVDDAVGGVSIGRLNLNLSTSLQENSSDTESEESISNEFEENGEISQNREDCRCTDFSVSNTDNGGLRDTSPTPYCDKASAEDNAGNQTMQLPNSTENIEHGADQEDNGCNICMDNIVQVEFSPCNHRVCFHCACGLCVRASDEVQCPFCRSNIRRIRRLHTNRCCASLKTSSSPNPTVPFSFTSSPMETSRVLESLS